MVVGEGQILGQVREAYRAATEELCAGPILNRLFTPPCGSARGPLGDGDRGQLPLCAARRGEARRGGLRDAPGRRALVLGAGEMSELVVKHLKSSGVRELRLPTAPPDGPR
jgi:glutamyl-tRNA reductase